MSSCSDWGWTWSVQAFAGAYQSCRLRHPTRFLAFYKRSYDYPYRVEISVSIVSSIRLQNHIIASSKRSRSIGSMMLRSFVHQAMSKYTGAAVPIRHHLYSRVPVIFAEIRWAWKISMDVIRDLCTAFQEDYLRTTHSLESIIVRNLALTEILKLFRVFGRLHAVHNISVVIRRRVASYNTPPHVVWCLTRGLVRLFSETGLPQPFWFPFADYSYSMYVCTSTTAKSRIAPLSGLR